MPTISLKEKELAAVAASISAGCQACSDFHFKKVLEVGASEEELRKAVSDATSVIKIANEIMQNKASVLLKDAGYSNYEYTAPPGDRVTELVKIAAIVAVNCSSAISVHIQNAKEIGVPDADIKIVIGVANMVKNKAAEFVTRGIEQSLGEGNVEEVSLDCCSGSPGTQTDQTEKASCC